jgi:hypothetical protein
LAHPLGLDYLIRLLTVLMVGLYVILPLSRASRREIPLIFGLLVPCFALFTAAVNISLRPMAVTAVFLAVQWVLMDRYRRRAIGLWPLMGILAVIYALWGNLHTGVVMGLFSLGLTLVGDTLEWKGLYRYEPETEAPSARCPGAYALMLISCFGASLINPYGFGIYSYLADLSSQSYLNSAIVELQSPNFHFVRYGCFAVLLGVMMLLMTRARQVMSASAWLHVILFSALTLMVQRFVVWACLYYALLFPQALYAYWKASGRPWASVVSGFNIYHPLFVLLMGVSMCIFSTFPKALAPVHLYMPFQHGACEPLINGIHAYSKLKTPDDRLLNDSDTGSCMLYAIPEQKVFIDTRFDFYAEDFVKQHRDALSLLGDFPGYLKQWNINTVVVSRQWPAYYAMKTHPEFETLYDDKVMGIFRKRTATGDKPRD